MKADPKVKKQIVDALRSGEFKQAFGALCRPTTSPGLESDGRCYCVEGVICELYARSHPEATWQERAHGRYYFVIGNEVDPWGVPPEVCRWVFPKRTDDSDLYVRSESLIHWNDDIKLTFPQIADFIEAEW